MKTSWFSPQVEAVRALSTESYFLPRPPPTTPLSLGKPQHTSLKQNSPSSPSPFLFQRWLSHNRGSKTQHVPMWRLKGEGEEEDGAAAPDVGRRQHGMRSSWLLLHQGSLELAHQASMDALANRHGSSASSPALKPLGLRCATATGSAPSAGAQRLHCGQLGQPGEIAACWG